MIALLVVDMIEGMFSGSLAARRPCLCSSINDVIDAADAGGVPVIWAREEYREDLSNAPLRVRREQIKALVLGAHGTKILPELHLRPDHVVVVKTRFSAFFKTELDSVLLAMDINALVVVGVNTMSCVRATVIDAYMRDMGVYLVSDGVAAYDEDQHRDSMRYMSYSCARVLSSHEAIGMLERRGAPFAAS